MKHTSLSWRTISLLVVFALCSWLATRVHSDAALRAATIQGVIFRVTVTKLEPVTIAPGALVRYEVKVKNITNRLGSATVVARVPNSFVYQGATGWGSTCWSWANGMLYCSALRIDAGKEKTVIASYRIPATFSCAQPSVSFQVTVSGAGATTQTDPLVCTRCGDGITQLTEQCDDGNQVNNDACSNTCLRARCGDSLVQLTEQCDDGNQVDDDACTNACAAPRCGDSILQAGEQCDDGNQIDTDTCSNVCIAARCGDGIRQAAEQCDDGNEVNEDSCSNTCALPRCGDGILQLGEQCDDANTTPKDGCSDRCHVEADLSVPSSNYYRTPREGSAVLRMWIRNSGPGTAKDVMFSMSYGSTASEITFGAVEGCVTSGRSITCRIGDLESRGLRIFSIPVSLSDTVRCGQPGVSVMVIARQTSMDLNYRDDYQFTKIMRDCSLRSSTSSRAISSAQSSFVSQASSALSSESSESSASSAVSSVSSLTSQASSSEHSSASDASSLSSAQSSFHAAASSSESSESVSASSSSAVSVSSVVSSSAVSSSSSQAVCRNGIVEAGEECDDKNSINDDRCTNACRLARCGDGIRQWPDEQCDDGNSDNYDRCPNDCSDPRCGDGVREGLEQCDDGQQNGKKESDCTYQCTLIEVPALCGDGVVQDLLFSMRNEACDDGNTVSGDGCRRNCQREHPELCGNGRVDATEQCDDGNTTEWDGCTNCIRDSLADILSSVPKKIVTGQTATLTIEGLNLQPRADSVVIMIDLKNLTYVAEASDARCKLLGKSSVVCTAPNVASGQKMAVTVGVTSPVAGMYELEASVRSTQRGQKGARILHRFITVEQPGCGNNVVESGEQCDWGPMSNAYCTAQCRLTTAASLCGDGRIEGKEQCDDGNMWNTDGCDNACMKEFFCRTIDLDPRDLATKLYDVQSNITSYRGTCWYRNGNAPVTSDMYTRNTATIGCRQYCSRFGANKYNATAQTWMVQQPDNCKRLYLMYKYSSASFTPAKYNPTPAQISALGTFFNDTYGNPGCGERRTVLQGQTPWSYSASYNPDGYTWGGIVHFCACDN